MLRLISLSQPSNDNHARFGNEAREIIEKYSIRDGLQGFGTRFRMAFPNINVADLKDLTPRLLSPDGALHFYTIIHR